MKDLLKQLDAANYAPFCTYLRKAINELFERHAVKQSLPGQSIAVLDPQQKLVVDIFLNEDGVSLDLRRVVIQLHQPTRHGDKAMGWFG